jgi:hypothetical protein
MNKKLQIIGLALMLIIKLDDSCKSCILLPIVPRWLAINKMSLMDPRAVQPRKQCVIAWPSMGPAQVQ